MVKLIIYSKNSKYELYGDRDETINQIISECSKLAQNK